MRATHLPDRTLLPCLLAAALVLSACAPIGAPDSTTQRIDALLPADIILIGEQHDATEHQQLERESVEALASQKRLGALAIEMAEQGNDTSYLAADATEAQVQTALAWSEQGWPWASYGPVVMAAVRAGVPVFGANLPRARMKDAMADVSLDAQLTDSAMKAQQEAVREGHCNLLPEAQILPMTRIQIARDRAMAQTLMKARVPGKTVVLVSGAGHNARVVGVPQQLPTDVRVRTLRLQAGDAAPSVDAGPGAYDAVWRTPAQPPHDYCAELKASRARQ